MKAGPSPGQVPLFGTGRAAVNLVIDVSNLVYRAAMSRNFRDLAHEGRPTGHVYGAFSMLLALRRHWAPGREARFVLAVDQPCSWRRQLDSRYKANRGADRLGTGTLEDVLAMLALLPGTTVRSTDHEADDVVAAVVRRPGDHVVFSLDRDLWQLVDRPGVQLVTATRDRPVSTADLIDTFGTDRAQFIPIVKSALGDTSDNVMAAFPRISRPDLSDVVAGMSEPTVPAFQAAAAGLAASGRLKPNTVKVVGTPEYVEHFARNLDITTLRPGCPLRDQPHRPDRDGLAVKLAGYGCRSVVDRLAELY